MKSLLYMCLNDSLARVPHLFREVLRHLPTTVGEILGGLNGMTIWLYVFERQPCESTLSFQRGASASSYYSGGNTWRFERGDQGIMQLNNRLARVPLYLSRVFHISTSSSVYIIQSVYYNNNDFISYPYIYDVFRQVTKTNLWLPSLKRILTAYL